MLSYACLILNVSAKCLEFASKIWERHWSCEIESDLGIVKEKVVFVDNAGQNSWNKVNNEKWTKTGKTQKTGICFCLIFLPYYWIFFFERDRVPQSNFEIIAISSKVLMHPRILSLLATNEATRMQRLFYVIPKCCDFICFYWDEC